MQKADGRCTVTLLPFSMVRPKGMRIRPWLPSIDRIRSDKSYSADNIRIVCAFVNVALNGFGEHLFTVVLKSLVDAAVKIELAKLGILNSLGSSEVPFDSSMVPENHV